ncbi:MAG: hypothetical protein H7X97_00430 [Opitutaceae bacterium]|nr:hypothetical protein [Verrucomicrobiales bacterium]
MPLAILACGLTLMGISCASRDLRPVPTRNPGPGGITNRSTIDPIMTPARSIAGRVVTVNTAARFVVLTYSFGFLPPIDQRLNVYRLGRKVGELKVTGPQQDTNTAADLLSGEIQIGDEARPD